MSTLINYYKLGVSSDLKHLQDKVFVHKDCRRDFTNPKQVITSILHLHIMDFHNKTYNQAPFVWKANCLLCTKLVEADNRYPEGIPVYEFTIMQFQETVKLTCLAQAVNWWEEVKHFNVTLLSLISNEGEI